jgi:hypothetical protein
MNVGQLKKLLLSLPDDLKLVMPGYDHSYREADASVGTAMLTPDRVYTEDHGDEYTPEGEDFGKRVKVLIID